MAPVLPRIREQGQVALHRLVHLRREDSAETRLALAEIIRQVIGMRDELIAAKRSGEPCDEALQGINAVLSSIFGLEFPAGGLHWKRLKETEDGLKALLLRLEGQPCVRQPQSGSPEGGPTPNMEPEAGDSVRGGGGWPLAERDQPETAAAISKAISTIIPLFRGMSLPI